MSSTTVGAPVDAPSIPSAAGPLEARHMRSAAYRDAAQSEKVTRTHWHIAWANGLG